MHCGFWSDKATREGSRHRWIVAITAIGLVAGHGMVLHYISAHTTMSKTLVAGVIALILVKHLGLFGAVFAALRRAWRARR